MRLKIEKLKSVFKQCNLKDAFIYVKAKKGYGNITIYNDVLRYETSLDGVELRENENIEFLSGLKLLSDLVSKFNENEEISLNVDNNTLFLQAPKSLYSLSLYDLKTLKQGETIFNDCISVDLKRFKKAIKKVMFAINPNCFRTELQGLHLYTRTGIDKTTKFLVFETTDSQALAKYELADSFVDIQQDIDVIIPFETLQNLLLLPEKEETLLYINLNGKKTIVYFECENVDVCSVLIEGSFPSMDALYKLYYDIKISFEKEELVNALNRLSLFDDVVKFDLQCERISASDKDSRCEEQVKISKNYIEKDFFINVRINDWLNAMKQVEDTNVNISFLESRKPFKIIDGDLLIVLTPTVVY